MENIKILDENFASLFEDIYYIKRNCEDIVYITISCKLKEGNCALKYQDFILLEEGINNIFEIAVRELSPEVIKLLITKFNLNIASYKYDKFGGTESEMMFSKFVPDFKSEIQDIISLKDGNSIVIEYFDSKDKLSWFEK